MSTLQLNIVLTNEAEDDPVHYLQRVLSDMRAQGKWQIEYLTAETGVSLRDPSSFLRIGTLRVNP